jgi:hypothetical protein
VETVTLKSALEKDALLKRIKERLSELQSEKNVE